ncbi:MAG: acyloxyacyl hydrolase [Bacteroidales bacterium]|nr:acyloxyacyl hydrolase [Bacteroidales bacterium]
MLIIFSFFTTGKSQDTIASRRNIFYLEPEYSIGKIVPNRSRFPGAGYSSCYSLNLGVFYNSPLNGWASFYNYPFSGVTLSMTDLGNEKIFGKQFTVMPFIEFNTANRLENSIYLKIGLGCSYFTKHFDGLENRKNKEIGSSCTWSFQSFMYYSLFVSQNLSINIGGGYLHSSNGHIQLPNYGLNQAALSVSTRFFTSCINPAFQPKNSRVTVNRDMTFYLMARSGLGIHEYGSANGPVGGPKRLVNSLTVSSGVLLREYIKLDAGFTARYYHHYYHQILNTANTDYSDEPRLNASNLYFFLGVEFLVGHIGMDIEGGLNLFKPYYREHYLTMEGDTDFDYWLKQLFNTKLGLDYYLINPKKTPKLNGFLGASINANFGQADFSEVCAGMLYYFR